MCTLTILLKSWTREGVESIYRHAVWTEKSPSCRPACKSVQTLRSFAQAQSLGPAHTPLKAGISASLTGQRVQRELRSPSDLPAGRRRTVPSVCRARAGEHACVQMPVSSGFLVGRAPHRSSQCFLVLGITRSPWLPETLASSRQKCPSVRPDTHRAEGSASTPRLPGSSPSSRRRF